MDYILENGSDVLNGVSFDEIPGGSSLFVDLIAGYSQHIIILLLLALDFRLRLGYPPLEACSLLFPAQTYISYLTVMNMHMLYASNTLSSYPMQTHNKHYHRIM